MTVGWSLLAATAALVVAGCILYVAGFVGWAQAAWVMASGTAGGCIAVFVDARATARHDPDHLRRQPP